MSNIQHLSDDYYNQGSNTTLTPLLQDESKDSFGDVANSPLGYNFSSNQYLPQEKADQKTLLDQIKSYRNEAQESISSPDRRGGRSLQDNAVKNGGMALRLDTSFNDAFSPCDYPLSALTADTGSSKDASPSKSTTKRERPKNHTPRPSNSFILYRREKHIEIMNQYKGAKTLNNNVISKIVANMWKSETPEVKAHFASLADAEKRAHMLKYPDYKYRPRKSTMKKSPVRKASITTPKSKGAATPVQTTMIQRSPFTNNVTPIFHNMNEHQPIQYIMDTPSYQPVHMLEPRMLECERAYGMMGNDGYVLSPRFGEHGEFLRQETLLAPVDYSHSWGMGNSVNGVWDLCLERKPFDQIQE